MNVIRKFLFMSLISLVFCSGCNRQAQPEQKLSVAVYYGEQSSLILYAKDSGLFRKYGLDVTLVDSKSGVTAVDEVAAGRADLATAAEFVFMLKHVHTPSLRILCSIDEAQSISVTALTARGISSPQDLKGKRIGVTKSSVAEYFMDRFLADHGISSDSVKIAYLAPDLLLENMQKGQTDASVVWNPVAEKIRREFAGEAVSWPAQRDQMFHFTVISDAGIIKSKTDAVRRFMAALTEAGQVFRRYPKEVRRTLAKPLSVTPEQLEKVWQEHDFGVRLNRSLIVALEMQTRWAIKKGLVSSRRLPNYLNLIDFELLKQVNSKAVTIIH